MLRLSLVRTALAAGAWVTGLGLAASALVGSLGGLVPTTLRDFQMPGTQPATLTQQLHSSQLCSGCHGYYDLADGCDFCLYTKELEQLL